MIRPIPTQVARMGGQRSATRRTMSGPSGKSKEVPDQSHCRSGRTRAEVGVPPKKEEENKGKPVPKYSTEGPASVPKL